MVLKRGVWMSVTERRMLVVDDEQDIGSLLVDFFSSRGFSASWAFSGEEALTRLAQTPTDILILDIKLPGLSGIEILRRVKEQYPHVRVVMVTALDQEDLRQQAQRYGAAGYITKPFDFADHTWSVVWDKP